ncbi:hypothetical protein [Ferrovum myxofaciens]|uniref:EF-hand domain-containing protein n=2 Tax=Ferrovum myxofaciens TaxID=416213 RepID=A0A8F3IJR9_9PROT|nr:hypothetical protein [Ferrovum myxofaciens]KXW58798.1 hypothetical protein FEMY_06760 [Ferrovum myxofaciens]MBU6995712.1 hypothetical protein [Ferrovum myxofaciens]QKE39515.2 MAG: hypothetical protein HO273_12960 [Ferrovum myxofaciens]QWY77542.1 MAG: hypothetical protein JZL65_00175 [Ferrovum myxofaciens]
METGMVEVPKVWRFFRAGGFDQVKIETASDLLELKQLNQKLWVALSCPVKGLQFDERTLSLIDTDQDGHVRVPELLAAIDWAADRLIDPEILACPQEGLRLSHLREDEKGCALAEQARRLLADLGKTEFDALTVTDVEQAQTRFMARLRTAWEDACPASLPLGEKTPDGYLILKKVADKLDDYFLRCRILAFEGKQSEELVTEAQHQAVFSSSSVAREVLLEWPLALVDSSGCLPLIEGLNPVWAGAMTSFRTQVVIPLLGERATLAESEWIQLKDIFSEFADWQGAGPVDTENETVRDLEKLVRLVRDLMLLANNFVSFKAFYTRTGQAIFQAGTLYLDSRSCELCVTVNDTAKHALLANSSNICLVYCDCTRAGQKTTIAAAFTDGDSDQLRVGRNGVFYDAKGQDWDATITRILEQPISLRQAFWSPYKKMVRAISDQFEKFASSRAKAADDKLVSSATLTTKNAAGGTSGVAQQAFDVGKFAGIFAAIGMAVGAIGTALASVAVGLFSLAFWQIPFVLLGVLLLISGPSLLLAWFKLRSRTLGPILDANGWAINARAKINLLFGASLTQLAQLPPNAERTLTDPFAEEDHSAWIYVVWGAVAVMVVAMLWAMRTKSH